MPPVKPIPDGFQTITPHITVQGAKKAIEFYKNAFGAEELGMQAMPDGNVMHALIRIGDSFLMLNDEFPQMGAKGPRTIGGTPVTLHLYVSDVDKSFDRAIRAGATTVMPVADQFWGDRYGILTDPFGHQWSIATHKRDVTPEEMQKAVASMPRS
jgi:PhnB protein